MVGFWYGLRQKKYIPLRNGAISDGLRCDDYTDGLNMRNYAIAAKVDAGKSRLYDDLSGRIVYTLVFQHHAELVNIVGDNDIRTHIVAAKEDGRPEYN